MLTFFDPRQKPILTLDFVEPNLNLLAHAQSAEIDIGSQCGGHGVCGKDRVLIRDPAQRESLSPLTECERNHLSEIEIEAGWRLACQTFPNHSDRHLDIELSFSGKSQGGD